MNNKLRNKIRQLLVFGIFACALLVNSNAIAQVIDVTGNVTSVEDGSGLPGVNVIVKGTATGVTTDFDGNYSITLADANATLVFSSIGFTPQEIAINGKNVINVVLEQSAEALNEVVVTALGIKREEKSLGYSVSKVDGEELTRVVQENVLNSMSGKVSGVTISSTGGTGSSVSMIIRGATSLSTDNQPLFVVDGVPIGSTVNNIRNSGSRNSPDYGNAISDLDPESIENVTILKGPSAAALYGARAGNGVVLITTKKAKEGQKMSVSITSNTVFDIPTRFLNVDTRQATGGFSFRPEDVGTNNLVPFVNPAHAVMAGSDNDKGYFAVQWDAPLDANGNPIPTELVSYADNYRNFFNDYAHTTTNGASVSSSANSVNYRVGFTNMRHEGLIPNSDLNKNNVSFSGSTKLWDKLTMSTDVNFSNSWADNRPSTTDRGTNPLEALYSHPTNIDIRKLINYNTGGDDILRVSSEHENPYFIANEINNSFNRYRLYGNMTANYEFSPSFSVMGRVTLNKSDEIYETKIAPGYNRESNNGYYSIASSEGLERNIDFLATYNKDWEDFTLTTSVGGNNLYQKGSGIAASTRAGLVVPEVYTIQNIASSALNYGNSRFEKAIYSVYGLANLGYKNMLYLDITARNDWSSTLPAENRSYFYPSASLSLLVDKVFDLGQNVNMFKIRGGWAQVGNDTSPYRLNATYGNAGQWDEATRLTKSSSLLAPSLLPEESTSIEFGTDVKMFSNRLRFEGTYYTIDNKNQILGIPLAGSTGFGSVQINAGLLQSTGWEFLLGGTPVQTEDWSWDVDVNFSTNETVVKELSDGVDFIDFWDKNKVKSVAYVKGYVNNINDGPEDGLVGNIYARDILRVKDESSPYFGYPILDNEEGDLQGEETYSKVGNYNPDFVMGLQSSLSFKQFTLDLTFDWRSGGQFNSGTNRRITDGLANPKWRDDMVDTTPGGGVPGDALRDWVVANEDDFILNDNVAPIGGTNPGNGGLPESFSGTTVFDGSFMPGVIEEFDTDGNLIGYTENLGNEGTFILPYYFSYPWAIGKIDVFDADYIKLREVSLSYRLPNQLAENMGLQSLSFSVYSRNIMLWTKDPGLGVDPERAFQSNGSGFAQGSEQWNAMPWIVPVGFKIGVTF